MVKFGWGGLEGEGEGEGEGELRKRRPTMTICVEKGGEVRFAG